MHYFRKIISCFVLFAIISPCVIVESKAADYTSKSNFWTWSSQYTWGLGDQLLGMASDSVCTESEDEKHHASSYQYDAGNGYYRCVCQHCGETFLAYESDISSAYDSYVDDLQTDLGTTTLIDGGIRLYAKPKAAAMTDNAGTIAEQVNVNGGSVVNFKFNKSGASLKLMVDYLKAPFNCTYVCGYSYERSNPGPVSLSSDSPFSGSASKGEYFRYTQNQVATCSFKSDSSTVLDVWSTYFFSLWVDVYPLASLGSLTSQDITINSRPSTIVGDYGIIGDDGSITKIDGDLIVDESANTVYNPVTNTTHNYTDCAYDYSDRSYNLTLEDGSTMKVVYGDENVTIEEGDTVYNVYYLTSGSEDGSGGSGGVGDDGSGGIGGAIGGLFDVLGEIIYGLIEGTINLATKALSALTGLLDLLKQFGESIVGFFGGYLDFLGAVFPFLPEETFTILNLGLILMIAAAVFKKFL